MKEGDIHMIKSMTGYGRAELSTNGYRAIVEIKAVNHRYAEFVFRMPRDYLMFEESLKKIVAAHVRRGRLDVYITVEKTSLASHKLSIDMSLAESVKRVADQLESRLGLQNNLTVADMIQIPDLMRIEEESDQEIIGPLLEQSVREAVQALVHMRQQEGQRLKLDFHKRLHMLQEIVQQMEKRSPQTVHEYKEKLELRMRELLNGLAKIEESRILTEIALMADRVSIVEELVRLKSHMEQFFQVLQAEEPVGRKLDFLVQEMNREVNTIGSKANDLSLSTFVVEAKSILEQIREQVQNVE